MVEESKRSEQEMAQKRFEFENEVLEEELYKFDEAEVDRLFEQKPWRSK